MRSPSEYCLKVINHHHELLREFQALEAMNACLIEQLSWLQLLPERQDFLNQLPSTDSNINPSTCHRHLWSLNLLIYQWLLVYRWVMQRNRCTIFTFLFIFFFNLNILFFLLSRQELDTKGHVETIPFSLLIPFLRPSKARYTLFYLTAVSVDGSFAELLSGSGPNPLCYLFIFLISSAKIFLCTLYSSLF